MPAEPPIVASGTRAARLSAAKIASTWVGFRSFEVCLASAWWLECKDPPRPAFWWVYSFGVVELQDKRIRFKVLCVFGVRHIWKPYMDQEPLTVRSPSYATATL